MMTNEYLEHYTQHKISPVRQNIDDLQKHFYIRKKLYEVLGLTKSNFEGKSVLEIGPGGGYNSIYTASLQPKLYQLIEANAVGVEELQTNFQAHQISLKNIKITNSFIETFKSKDSFDIAICEGMLPCVKNNYEILHKIDSLLKPDGIMLITCSDEISIFFDMARRLLANILLQREEASSFEEKVSLLVEAFGSHLDTLAGFGRLKEDWCADNLLGDALYNTNLSVSDVIEMFGDSYSFYHLSPAIISDSTWFKEVPSNIKNYNKTKLKSFYNIWHNFLHYKSFDTLHWSYEASVALRENCKEFILLCKASETHYDKESIEALTKLLQKMQTLLTLHNSDAMIIDAIKELKIFLQKDAVTPSTLSQNFDLFKSAFGRGQQYLSLIKEN